jgi:hypothetical protein
MSSACSRPSSSSRRDSNSSSICTAAVRPVSTSRPSVRLLFGLISTPRSFLFLQNRLRVPPFTSGLPATGPMFYPQDVTAGSQAPGFTITTASSAYPPSHIQIPHWLAHGSHLAVLLFLEVRTGVSSGTLAFAYMFPAPRAMAGLSPASRLTCRSHIGSEGPKPRLPTEPCVRVRTRLLTQGVSTD